MSNAKKTANLFSLPAISDDAEQIATLASAAGMRIERIVSHGHSSPADFWYDQDEDEWVILLTGAAGLTFDDGNPPQTLQPGDYLLIPAGERHRVAWTAPDQETVWLAIFSSTPMRAAP
ncbi:cupin domain-containing protein [Mariprofundus ferrooxydans]|uniref:cupin domain-containing protein n=1 Tax=Mariprofundus ferrooxydans TaxID=314344 RepID=UPI00037D65B3|nr:cupin domain-containing protein [Mariprofundus ferrooxydans]